jgi:two-component system LytT family response regulator
MAMPDAIPNKISCLVVDDDRVDLLTTLSFLEDYPFLEIAGKFGSPAEGLAAAQEKAPDVLFLDIDMPGMNGLQLRGKLLHIPACIFITSYPDYAVEGFEMEAFDFLVKPISEDRLARTMERLKDYFAIRRKAALLNHTLGADTIFIKDGTAQVKLQLHEIVYFEALNNYTSIVTVHRKYAVLSTMGNLLKEESFRNFIRIHRSYAVHKHFIKKISSGEVLAGSTSLPVGRKYKEVLNDLKIS